jgi:Arc/MetJ-type ribon-helix-helix transcriptional regulator
MSEFVQGAVSAAASARKAQDEFIARGRASVAQARTSNEFYSAREALTEMTQRLTAKAKTHGKKKSLARP